MKENIYNEISELKSTRLPDILLELVGKIDDLEFRLSHIDRLPYPAHDENGELRYDIFNFKEVK